jgi:hypothetical protein
VSGEIPNERDAGEQWNEEPARVMLELAHLTQPELSNVRGDPPAGLLLAPPLGAGAWLGLGTGAARGAGAGLGVGTGAGLGAGTTGARWLSGAASAPPGSVGAALAGDGAGGRFGFSGAGTGISIAGARPRRIGAAVPLAFTGSCESGSARPDLPASPARPIAKKQANTPQMPSTVATTLNPDDRACRRGRTSRLSTPKLFTTGT